MRDYVEQRDGGYYVEGTRISLDSIVHSFNNGASPETILQSFPMMQSLELVYGAITFYLSHKEAVDRYLDDQHRLWDDLEKRQTSERDSVADQVRQARQPLTSR